MDYREMEYREIVRRRKYLQTYLKEEGAQVEEDIRTREVVIKFPEGVKVNLPLSSLEEIGPDFIQNIKKERKRRRRKWRLLKRKELPT